MENVFRHRIAQKAVHWLKSEMHVPVINTLIKGIYDYEQQIPKIFRLAFLCSQPLLKQTHWNHPLALKMVLKIEVFLLLAWISSDQWFYVA